MYVLLMISNFMCILICQKHGKGTFKVAKGGSYIGGYDEDMVSCLSRIFSEIEAQLFSYVSQEMWGRSDAIFKR